MPTPQSNLFWTLDQLPAENANMTVAWANYALSLLRAVVLIAKSAATALVSMRNVTGTGTPGVLLGPALDEQADSLFAMADAADAMIVRVVSDDSSLNPTRIALARYSVGAVRFYTVQGRPDVVRFKMEDFNPFLMVQEKVSRYPYAILRGTDAMLEQLALQSDMTTWNVVGVVGPMAFVTEEGKQVPTGNDLLPATVPTDQNGSTILLSEDTVHQIIGKLLDFSQTVWSQMATEMKSYAAQHPVNNLPALPAAPPVVMDVNEQLPPPPEATGGTKVGAVELPVPPGSAPPQAVTGPSGWTVIAALVLTAGVAYATWKVTDAMMEKKPSRRLEANPFPKIPGHRNFWVGELYAEVNEDNGFGQWEMLVSTNGVVIGHAYGNLPLPDDRTLRRRVKYLGENMPQSIWGAG